MLLLVGVTMRAATAAALVTLAAAVPEIEPLVAVMVTAVVAVTVDAVARPLALMASTDVLLDDQVTVVVRSFCDWSV